MQTFEPDDKKPSGPREPDGFVLLTDDLIKKCPVVVLFHDTGPVMCLVEKINADAIQYQVLDPDHGVPLQRRISRWGMIYESVQNDGCRSIYETIRKRDKLSKLLVKKPRRQRKASAQVQESQT